MKLEEFNGLFITGSDTGVGKTVIGAELVEQLCAAGVDLAVRKPVESGCEFVDGELLPADGQRLYEANRHFELLEQVTPYRFKAALAPPRAAHLEYQTLKLQQLIDACQADRPIIAEGAGGFLSPLAEDALNRDLAQALGLPVVVVAEDRLGGVNQALMTIEAVRAAGLEVALLVFNQTNIETDPDLDNVDDIRPWFDGTVVRCAYASPLSAVFS